MQQKPDLCQPRLNSNTGGVPSLCLIQVRGSICVHGAASQEKKRIDAGGKITQMKHR